MIVNKGYFGVRGRCGILLNILKFGVRDEYSKVRYIWFWPTLHTYMLCLAHPFSGHALHAEAARSHQQTQGRLLCGDVSARCEV